MADPTLEELAYRNSAIGGVDTAQGKVLPAALPHPPHADDDGVDLGPAQVGLAAVELRQKPGRYQADVVFDTFNVGDNAKLVLDGIDAIYTISGGDDEASALTELAREVNDTDAPLRATAFDSDGDGTVDTINLEGNWWKVRLAGSVENTTDYEVTINGTLYSYTSDADATVDEIISGLAAEVNGASDLEAVGVDSSGSGNKTTLMFASLSADSLQVSPNAKLRVDAQGSPAPFLVEDDSTGSVVLDIEQDATRVVFDVWLYRDGLGWFVPPNLIGIEARKNWAENLQALAYFDRGFIRVRSANGRCWPAFVPAHGAGVS